jgi:hypothetical protein
VAAKAERWSKMLTFVERSVAGVPRLIERRKNRWFAAKESASIMKRTLLSWSSGKDSAWSLHLLRQQNEHEIVGLLTTPPAN